MTANTNTFSLETMYRVWDDKTGDRVEVGPDSDGLDLLEIRSYTNDGKLEVSILLKPEMAPLVADAIYRFAAERVR